MDEQTINEQLCFCQFTLPLSQAARRALVDVSQRRQLAAGDVIFREGTPADEFYLICSGRVTLEMGVPGRGETPILSLEAGDMLGWSALLGGGPMTARATAVEPTELIVAEGAVLRRMCEEDHDFGYEMMQQMAIALSRRLLATRLQLLDLFAPASSEEQG